MWKKIIIFLIIIAVLGGGFLVIKNKNSSRQTTANVQLVKMVEAEEETLTTKVTADGNVSAKEQKDIKASLSGIIGQVFVESGDLLEEGEGVYRLEDEPLINSLKTAKLNLQEVQGNYDSLLNKYKAQDKLNKLKLEETRRNLEIATLSYRKEKAVLEDQRLKLEKQLIESKNSLEKSEKKLEENSYLYEKDAIPENTLKQSRDTYQQAKRNYENLKADLKVFIDKTIPNTLELAQLKIDNARDQLAYLEASLEADKITNRDLDMAQLKVTKVENQISEIKENLNKIVTTAPIAGTVIDLKIKAGDKVADGTTVGNIADLNKFIVEAMVDEININEISLGQSVIITSDSFGKDLEGEVTFIAPAGSNVGNINKYRTEISISDDMGLLRPGMFVNAEIITNRKDNVIAVPSLAILGDEEKYVFVVKDGKAEKRTVELGLKTLSKIEINNIEKGEKIIIGPYTVLTGLEEGRPVAEVNNEGQQGK